MITLQEQYTTDRQAKTKETSWASKPRVSPEREKNTSTSAFQYGGSAPYPTGSNCLFSLLTASLYSGLRLVFLQTILDKAKNVGVWLSVCIPIPSYSREKVLPPKFELTPTSKQSSTVVRPISQFGRHCCPGVSKHVPVDGDSSCPVPAENDSS